MEATPMTKDAAATEAAKKKPLKVFNLGNVYASVFANDRKVKGTVVTFHHVSFSKEYRKGDQRRWTQCFDFGDLSKLAAVLSQASDYLIRLQYPNADGESSVGK